MAKTLTQSLNDLFNDITGHKNNIFNAIKRHVSVPTGEEKLSRAAFYIEKMNEQIETKASNSANLQAELDKVKRENTNLKNMLQNTVKERDTIKSELQEIDNWVNTLRTNVSGLDLYVREGRSKLALQDIDEHIRGGNIAYNWGAKHPDLIWSRVIYPNIEPGEDRYCKFKNGEYFLSVSLNPKGYESGDYIIDAAEYTGTLSYIMSRARKKTIAAIKDVKLT
nr:MAG TPA: Transcription factor HY5 leucine zipper, TRANSCRIPTION.0A [Caudoviricetes sp.]